MMAMDVTQKQPKQKRIAGKPTASSAKYKLVHKFHECTHTHTLTPVHKSGCLTL